MIFRIADCAYRTKVLPGNRATDGKKKAGPRKEGRPCVILCWHVRAASRTCRSAMRRFGKLLPFRLFRRLYLHRASLPGLRHMAESPRSFRFGEKRLPSRLPKEQKSRLRLRRVAICFCQSLRYLLYYFTSSKSTSVTLLSPAACDCPPPAPVPLAPAPDWAPAFGPCWAFCWALYISCEAACHALLSSVVALSMSARF